MKLTLFFVLCAGGLLVASIIADRWSSASVEFPGRQIDADLVFGLQRVYIDYTFQGESFSRQLVYDEFCSRNEFYSKQSECDELERGANATFALVLITTIGTGLSIILCIIHLYIGSNVFSIALFFMIFLLSTNVTSTIVWVTVANDAIEELTTDLGVSFLLVLLATPCYMFGIIRIGVLIKNAKEAALSESDPMINSYDEIGYNEDRPFAKGFYRPSFR